MPNAVIASLVLVKIAVPCSMTAFMTGFASIIPLSRSCRVRNASAHERSIVPVARKNNQGWCQSRKMTSESAARRWAWRRDSVNPRTTVRHENVRRSALLRGPRVAVLTAMCLQILPWVGVIRRSAEQVGNQLIPVALPKRSGIHLIEQLTYQDRINLISRGFWHCSGRLAGRTV